ncbi:MAG TPA: citrate/2-methylcitrate synthase, partial [Mycobacterium sp.]
MPEVSDVPGSPAGAPAVHDGNTAAAVPKASAADAPGVDRAVVEYAGVRLEPRIVRGTQGVSGLEISRLLADLGVVALDPGYANTGSTTSAVTYIDGEAGILRYRGYPIEKLAESASFLETSYLLIRGELPGPAELEAFTRRIGRHTVLHEDLKHFVDGFPRNADPVSVLSSAVSALSTFHGDALDPFDPEQVELSTVRLLAKVPTIAAYAYRKSVGQPLLYPDNSLGYVENFLRLSFGFPAEPYEQT